MRYVADNKAWEDAYEGYKKEHKGQKILSKEAWKSKIIGKLKAPNPKKVQVEQKQTWLEIHKDFLRWKKTPEFTMWRRKQFLKQGGTCYYCDEPLSGARENIEHIIPKSRSGNNRKSNLVIACARCNKEKNITILSLKARDKLKEKNRKKKGIYLKTKEIYPTEEDLGYQLREIFKED